MAVNPSAAGSPGLPKPPGDGSYLWIPASHYNHLVSSQAATAPHLPPIYSAHQGVAGYGPWGVVPAAYPVPVAAGPSPLETQIAALVGAMTAERQAAGAALGSPASDSSAGLRGSHKRRRCEYERDDYDGEFARGCPSPPYYPGEYSGSGGGEPGRRDRRFGTATRSAAATPHSNETIAALVGAVASLQQELTHLRSYQHGAFVPQSAAAQVWTPRPYFAPAAAAQASHQLQQAQPSCAPVTQTTPPAQVVPAALPAAPPAAPVQSLVGVVGAPMEPRAGDAADVASLEADAPPHLLNASCTTRVTVDANRASDAFVAQMMGDRRC
ncbi:capsid scaffold protein [Saimiriine alphaherpesvirus 1]|nr:capsid scaffold protein [Saimiriine alphaherpesvirus 1]AAM22797.1 UL26.5 [Saimiriine alphaherpesvirus 1]ADO13802.1 capsid scaffold protein [Saimiriine alphaherpesvirus 1]